MDRCRIVRCFIKCVLLMLTPLLIVQVARENFRRKNMFDAEEAQYRDQLDIFGNPKLPSPTNSSRKAGDNAIDSVVAGSSMGHGPIRSSYGNIPLHSSVALSSDFHDALYVAPGYNHR